MILKMENRGQIDKALGALPIFFLVLVIVALFVLLNAGVFSAKKASERIADITATRAPILFESIYLNSEGKRTLVSTLEAFNLTRGRGEIWKNATTEISKMTPENGCLLFLWTSNNDFNIYGEGNLAPSGFFVENKQGNTHITDSIIGVKNLYDEYSLGKRISRAQINFSLDGSSYTFMTYKGECLNE